MSRRSKDGSESKIAIRIKVSKKLNQWFTPLKLPECAARVSSAATENVSPYSTDHPAVAIRGFRKVYLNTSRGSSDLLGNPKDSVELPATRIIILVAEVVQAAGACYDRHGLPTVEKSAHCLNFSLTPEILLTLNTKSSMFGNEELCRWVVAEFDALLYKQAAQTLLSSVDIRR